MLKLLGWSRGIWLFGFSPALKSPPPRLFLSQLILRDVI